MSASKTFVRTLSVLLVGTALSGAAYAQMPTREAPAAAADLLSQAMAPTAAPVKAEAPKSALPAIDVPTMAPAPAAKAEASVAAPAPKPAVDPVSNLVRSATAPETQEIPAPAGILPRVTAPSANMLKDISELNARITVLKLQVEEAKLESELNKAREAESTASTAAPAAAQPIPGMPQTPGAPAASEPSERDLLPVVAAIQGTGDDLRARLVTPRGGNTVARKGQTIPNGFKVREVTASGVTLVSEKSGETYFVGLGSSATPADRRGGPAAGMPISFPPPVIIQ